MPSNTPYFRVEAVEATVTSNGQVTLLYDLEDLWKTADQGGKATHAMSFEEMNHAKAQRNVGNASSEQ